MRSRNYLPLFSYSRKREEWVEMGFSVRENWVQALGLGSGCERPVLREEPAQAQASPYSDVPGPALGAQ